MLQSSYDHIIKIIRKQSLDDVIQRTIEPISENHDGGSAISTS